MINAWIVTSDGRISNIFKEHDKAILAFYWLKYEFEMRNVQIVGVDVDRLKDMGWVLREAQEATA